MIKGRILSFLIPLFVFIFVSPSNAHAVIQSLNGQTGQSQSFANDTNLKITSSGNTHTLGWNGQLPISRGGTGAALFTDGSIPFIYGGIFSEDSARLVWDSNNHRLGIGTSTPQGSVQISNGKFIIGPASLSAIPDDLGADILGGMHGNFEIAGRTGDNDFFGTQVSIDGGSGGAGMSNGGGLVLTSGNGGLISGDSGEVQIGSGATFDGSGGNITLSTFSGTGSDHNGGNIILNVGAGTGTGSNGVFKFTSQSNSSTLYIGTSAQPGCIMLGDSDGDGVTYLIANDGVITASVTKPSICQ